MKISDVYKFDDVVKEIQAALQIDGSDYEEHDMSRIMDNIKKRINQHYSVDLTAKKITDTDLEMTIYRSSTAIFVDNVARLHADFCGLCHIARFTGDWLVKLQDVNYLGFDEDQLRTVLRCMQCSETVASVDDAVESIGRQLSVINICREKRLFLIIVVAHKLGFVELEAAIAEYLYYSMA